MWSANMMAKLEQNLRGQSLTLYSAIDLQVAVHWGLRILKKKILSKNR